MNITLMRERVEPSLSAAAVLLNEDESAGKDIGLTSLTLQVEAERQRMLTLAWRPGAHMHSQWWDSLGLASWRSVYASLPACRAPLDAAIVARRAWPISTLKRALDTAPASTQLQLMRLEPRLETLAIAAGLTVLRRTDYLLLREYRKALAPWLSDTACDQLLLLAGIKRADASGTPLAAVALPERARELGAAWLARDARACPACLALAMLLAPASIADAHTPLLPESNVGPFLLKLARFL
jgi:hypothetical protein